MSDRPTKTINESLARAHQSVAMRIARRIKPNKIELTLEQMAQFHPELPARKDFPFYVLKTFGLDLESLAKEDPTTALAVILSLFLGMPWGEIAPALDCTEKSSALKFSRARNKLRAGLRRIGTPPNAFATISRTFPQDTIVATPLGPNDANDKRLSKMVSCILRSESLERTAFLDILRDFTCLVFAESFDATKATQQLTELFRSTTESWAQIDFSGYAAATGGVGLTIVSIRDIHEEMDRMGRGPRKNHSEGATGEADRESRLTKIPVSVDAIEEFLAVADPAIPERILPGFESRVRDLLQAPLVPVLQRYLDLVQQEAAQLPGGNFGSFEKNKAFVDALRAALGCLDVRLECPTCRRPASLLLQQGTTKNGRFHFHHGATDLRTNHGGKTSLPPLRLIPPESASTTD